MKVPSQKSKKNETQDSLLSSSVEYETITKFTQIRVKSINFLGKVAIAIYFYDISHHLENMKLEREILQQKIKF